MIDYIDAVNRLVYLDASTVDATIQPIDIYRDMRAMRRTDEELRKYDVFMTMKGAEKKNPDGSKRTERYLVLLDGTLIVPYDTSHVLTIDGTMISDDGLEGIQCFNRANLSSGVEVDINYVPKQVEVITITTGGSALTTEEHNKLFSVSTDVWTNDTRTLTSAGSGGATAQEVWEYTTRELTTSTGGMTEAELHAGLDSYSNKDDYKASEVDMSVTNAKVDAVQTSVDALHDFDPTNDTVAHVALVDTTTTNTDMRGTDNANTLAPDEMTASELHGALDSYSNKDDWKADDIDMSVTNGKIDDLSTQLTTAEASVKTHVTTKTDTLATAVSITDLRSVVDDINTDMDALDENNVNSIYEKLLEVRADIAAAKTAGTYKAYD